MPQKPMNIVWYCTDQQRYDTLTCMGNTAIHTPNIDRLAREGVMFSRAYCQAPICTPSRASFLTGKYPCATKMFFNGNDNFSKDETLVTKLFADAGYTCGLAGKLHLTAAFHRMEKRGDDGYSFFEWSHHPYDDWEYGINSYQKWLKDNGYDWSSEYAVNSDSATSFVDKIGTGGLRSGIRAELHQTTWCTNEAIRFIEEQKGKEGGWLISINTFDPHPPLDPPQEYKDKLNIADMPLPLWKDDEMDNKPPHQQYDYIHGGQGGSAESVIGMTDDQKRERTRDYYAEIELIDDQVGRLVDYLDENGLRENTLVIFMSDHGEMLGDHGLYWKGAYFYEALTHVPLIISWPGHIQCGIRSDALVELMDIAPTLLDLAGMEIPFWMKGKSLKGILTGVVSPDHHHDSVYSEFYHCLARSHQNISATMYFDGRFKLVSYHGENYGELYDLQNDPNEFENLWFERDYQDLKHELVQKSFDQAILNRNDYSMHRISNY